VRGRNNQKKHENRLYNSKKAGSAIDLPSFFVNNYNLAISVQVLQNLLNVNAANNEFLRGFTILFLSCIFILCNNLQRKGILLQIQFQTI
jgi:hypothetical protein